MRPCRNMNRLNFTRQGLRCGTFYVANSDDRMAWMIFFFTFSEILCYKKIPYLLWLRKEPDFLIQHVSIVASTVSDQYCKANMENISPGYTFSKYATGQGHYTAPV